VRARVFVQHVCVCVFRVLCGAHFACVSMNKETNLVLLRVHMCRFSICGKHNAKPMEGQIKHGTLAFALAYARERGMLDVRRAAATTAAAAPQRAPSLSPTQQSMNSTEGLVVRRCSVSDSTGRRRRHIRPVMPEPVELETSLPEVGVLPETLPEAELIQSSGEYAVPAIQTNPLLLLDPPLFESSSMPKPLTPVISVASAVIPRVPVAASKSWWDFIPRFF